MTDIDKQQLGKTLWNIADQLRGSMNADDFRDYMLAFLFLRYLSDNYEASAKKELGSEYPSLAAEDRRSPLAVWYSLNAQDTEEFEKVLRRKVHYVIHPDYLWSRITELARTQDDDLLNTLQKGLKYIETESFASTFRGLFSEINLSSEKLGRSYTERNTRLCKIIAEVTKVSPSSPPAPTPWATPTSTSSVSSPPGRVRRPGSSTPPSGCPISFRPSSPSTATTRPPAPGATSTASSTSPAGQGPSSSTFGIA